MKEISDVSIYMVTGDNAKDTFSFQSVLRHQEVVTTRGRKSHATAFVRSNAMPTAIELAAAIAGDQSSADGQPEIN